MARTRRRMVSSRTTTRKRRFTWARTIDTSPTLVPTDALDLLDDYRTSLGLLANLPGTTVVRLIGDLQVEYEPTTVFDATSGIVFGVYVDTLGSTAAIPAAFPGEDWIWWQFWPVSYGFDAVGGTNTDRIFSIHVDARAARKLEEIQQTLFFVWSVLGPVDTATMQSAWSVGLKQP